MKLVIKGHLTDLCEYFKYPKEMMDFDFNKHMHFCLDNTVWDISRGTILKLGADKEVTHAFKGFKMLDSRAIASLYNRPPTFRQMQWPDAIN
jgi:hypothetical protein